jgi:hypothetical protein
MGFWIGDSELGTEENEEKGVTCNGVGNGHGHNGKSFLTQRFVHGGQTRGERRESQRKSLKKF